MKWNFQKNLNKKRRWSLFIINNFFKGGIKMEEKITEEKVIESDCEKELSVEEIQTTFNEDSLDVLTEEGSVENVIL
jgi:hypothetical protein